MSETRFDYEFECPQCKEHTFVVRRLSNLHPIAYFTKSKWENASGHIIETIGYQLGITENETTMKEECICSKCGYVICNKYEELFGWLESKRALIEQEERE